MTGTNTNRHGSRPGAESKGAPPRRKQDRSTWGNSTIAAPERPARLVLSVRAHLAVFALSIIVPLLCLLGLAGWVAVQQARREYEHQTILVTRNLAFDLDRELASYSGILKALATSPAIQDGDLRRFHEQAAQMAPPGGAIVMRDRSGQQLINTLFPFGTPLPVTAAPAVLAADECVFRTGAPCVSDLYVGTTDRQPYVLLDAPVMRDGEVVFALNIAVRAQRLTSLLSGDRTAPGWVVSILDRQDRIVARSAEHDRFVGQLANPALRANVTAAEGSVRSVNVAGVPVWGAYVRLPGWGWRVATGVPEAMLSAPLRQSMRYFGWVGLIGLGLSAAATLLYARQLAYAIGVLSSMTREVGRAAPLSPVSTSILEVNGVSASLAEAAANLRVSSAERDRAQADLRRLNEELQARVEAEVSAREEAQAKAALAQRMQALGQLAGGIAHDFNNVLQATTGCAATIDRRAADPEAVRRFARLILKASARGTSVTRRLLAFAQQSDLRAEPIDVAALFAGLQEILSHTLGSHIAVRVVVPSPFPWLLADRGQLETVLVNLATNARDAMQGGGSLTFAASAETIAGRAAPGGLQPGGYIRLAVTDTGVGMDGKTLARAAEPFFTTKGRGEGNGLGLAMARGFVEQSGGALAIESRLGEGTTVFLWFPVKEPVNEPVREPARGAAASPGDARAEEAGEHPVARKPLVLLVEDEDVVREVLVTELEDEGYEVLPARGAEEALSLLDRAGMVDALVTDLNMPGMNGLELIRAVRKRRASIPTVLLTGNAEDGVPLALEGAMTQNFSLLRKPVLGSDLADRLTSLTSAG
ncbi:hybrid sensor histidine kinase/response regulator [Muricoccus aerilatus]|uniref:hybrid sensor histidine kinase/response regulator n=1 Tax=Muricoccus aerilatus TaxID=452982 RepID=UPI0006933750|nr:response regulator [Roseomonas aerilata]